MPTIPVMPYDVETVLQSVAEKRPITQPVVIDVVPEDGRVMLTTNMAVDHMYLTPDQAVELIFQIKRVVLKVDPKALSPKRIKQHGNHNH